MPCPLNGPRNISEFVYGGEVKAMPDHKNCSDKAWAEYVCLFRQHHQNRQRVVVS
ncbi:sarcosine oxidase subunit delta [Enterovibrio sp. Hal110]